MLLNEYLNWSFPNFPKGIETTKELVDMIMKSLKQEYPSNIVIRTYKVLATKQLIVHCKLPSRKRRNLSFDVVFQFGMDYVDDPGITHLADAPFRVFSNSPSFYYSDAKVFFERDLLCEWLKGKYSDKVFEHDPTARNPDKAIRYERTIYTIGLWLAKVKYPEKSMSAIYRTAVPLSYNTIATHIQSQAQIETLYDTRKDTKAEANRKKEIAERQTKRRYVPKIATPVTPPTSFSKSVSKSAKVKHSNTVKRSKRV